MENIQMPKYEMPEMSEMLTSLFGGGDAKKATKSNSNKAAIKRKPQNWTSQFKKKRLKYSVRRG